MFSQIAQKNLIKDKNVLGRNWKRTYNDYFSDQENIDNFVKSIKPFLPNKELDILYVASASGLLGESLIKELGRGRLTLVDISKKHLLENKNKNTKKVLEDLLILDMNKKFDLIIMRSSLDYFPSAGLQIKILKIINRHLKTAGLFVNQPAYISSLRARDIISDIYTKIEKIGDRYFQSKDLKDLYKAAGYTEFKIIGIGKNLELTEQDHEKRYMINKNDILRIQSMIPFECSSVKITESGYWLNFEFPIFLAVKRKGSQ